MRIVGGRGFIGAHLNVLLRSAGHHTEVLGHGDPLVGGDAKSGSATEQTSDVNQPPGCSIDVHVDAGSAIGPS